MVVDLDEIEHRVRDGESMDRIAADVGVSDRTLRNRCHEAGRELPLRALRREQHSRLTDPVWLRTRFVDDGMPVAAIAKECTWTTAEVVAALESLGIERPTAPGLSPEELRQALDGEESVRAIARRLGVDRGRVRTAMERAGLTARRQMPSPSAPRCPASTGVARRVCVSCRNKVLQR